MIDVLHRFQSARTALELIEKAKKANEKLPEESRFDSNCITPGTEFMERLQQAFKHFVKLKLSNDPAWKHCRVILSGHEACSNFSMKFDLFMRDYLFLYALWTFYKEMCLFILDTGRRRAQNHGIYSIFEVRTRLRFEYTALFIWIRC